MPLPLGLRKVLIHRPGCGLIHYIHESREEDPERCTVCRGEGFQEVSYEWARRSGHLGITVGPKKGPIVCPNCKGRTTRPALAKHGTCARCAQAKKRAETRAKREATRGRKTNSSAA